MNKNLYKKHILIILLCFGSFVFSQNQNLSPEKLGFNQYTINDKELGEVNYYITKNKIDEEKKILLYLDGSGAYPLYQYTQKGIGSTVPVDYNKLSEDYHIILISKPGVPFIDNVTMNYELGYPEYDTPDEYTKRLSLEWRVNSANMVLQETIKNLKVDMDKIAILGISEGFQVGAKLASINNDITHSILMVGNGLTQFYDFIVHNRTDAQTGKISLQEAQKNIDSLQVVFKDIFQNPKSIEKEWLGHTYLRWSSFCKNVPAENILSVDIPTYIIACSDDTNTSVLGTDYIMVESARRGKENIKYEVFPYNHSFQEIIKDDEGNIVSKERHMTSVMENVMNWLEVSKN